MRNSITEFQALQNAANNIPGARVEQKYFEDRRRTGRKYFLSIMGNTISPTLDYENLNHFILGFNKAKEHFKIS